MQQIYGQLTKSIYQLDKFYLSIGYQQSVLRILMQRPQFCDKRFKINYMANFVQFFYGTPCIIILYACLHFP